SLVCRLDPRLKLTLVHQSLFIGVDQPRDAAANFGDLRLELLMVLLLRVGLLASQSPLQLALHAGRVGQELADIIPHRLIEQVLAKRLAAAQPLAAAAAGPAALAAVVAVSCFNPRPAV